MEQVLLLLVLMVLDKLVQQEVILHLKILYVMVVEVVVHIKMVNHLLVEVLVVEV